MLNGLPFWAAGCLRVLAALVLPVSAAGDFQPEPGELPRMEPLEPAAAAEAFQITPGFEVSLAAAEPDVVDPIGLAFDATGALFVVEMRDYSERRQDRLSRVRRLVDEDGDGRFDKSTVFLEGLAWATGIACWNGGVLVLATPDLIFARDADGDGVADEQRVVLSGFGAGAPRLNVQALANSLTWGPDGRLYGATAANGGIVQLPGGGAPIRLSGADFSLDPHRGDLRAESGTAQHGLSFDAAGRRYVCSNSRHLIWICWERAPGGAGGALPMPPPLVDIPVDGPAAEVFRISPEEPWRVVRTRWRASGLVPGIVEGGGRVSGYFTSACGVHVAAGQVARGDVLVGDVGSNLVHRKVLRETPGGPVAERHPAEKGREFLASRDTWFRPVAFADAPDGSLLVADMYREVVEHPDSLPPALKARLDLNSGHDRGRLWRVRQNGAAPFQVRDLSTVAAAELAGLLAHAGGWQRRTAQRLLLERLQAGELEGDTVAHLREAGTAEALQVLQAAGKLEAADLQRALAAEEPEVRAAALRLGFSSAESRARALELAADPSPLVRWQLAALLATSGAAGDLKALVTLWRQGLSLADPAGRLVLSALRSEHEALAFFQQVGGESGNPFALAAALRLDPRNPELAAVSARARDALRSRAEDAAAALEFLQRNPSEEERELIERVAVEGGPPISLRLAALRASPTAAATLLERWQEVPAELRVEVISRLGGSEAGALRLLGAVRDGLLLPAEVPPAEAERLRHHASATVREEAALRLPVPPDRRSAVAAALPALELEGDAARGREVFLQRCSVCHRTEAGEGSAVGPDHRTFSQKGKPLLLAALIDPNREVAPQYFTTVLHTADGTLAAGLLTHEDETSLRLRLPGGEERAVHRADVKKIERLGRSLMPEGLEAGLDPQALADLLEFLVR